MTDTRLQQSRLIAAAIDIGVGFALLFVLWIGGLVIGLISGTVVGESASGYLGRVIAFGAALVSLAYILGRDMFVGGRSLGKKLQNIRVVTGSGPITFVESVKRNAIFAVGSAVWLLTATIRLIPYVGDVIACVFVPLNLLGLIVSVAAVIVEVVKIMQDPHGIRFGDQFANTRVIE